MRPEILNLRPYRFAIRRILLRRLLRLRRRALLLRRRSRATWRLLLRGGSCGIRRLLLLRVPQWPVTRVLGLIWCLLLVAQARFVAGSGRLLFLLVLRLVPAQAKRPGLRLTVGYLCCIGRCRRFRIELRTLRLGLLGKLCAIAIPRLLLRFGVALKRVVGFPIRIRCNLFRACAGILDLACRG